MKKFLFILSLLTSLPSFAAKMSLYEAKQCIKEEFILEKNEEQLNSFENTESRSYRLLQERHNDMSKNFEKNCEDAFLEQNKNIVGDACDKLFLEDKAIIKNSLICFFADE